MITQKSHKSVGLITSWITWPPSLPLHACSMSPRPEESTWPPATWPTTTCGQSPPSLGKAEVAVLVEDQASWARQRCCRPREHWSLWDVFPVQLHCRHQRHLVHDQVFQLGLSLHGQAFGLGKVLQLLAVFLASVLPFLMFLRLRTPFHFSANLFQRCEALWNLMAARLHPDSPSLILEACCSCNSRSPFWRSNSFTSWACDGRSAGLSSLGAHRTWRSIPVAKLKAAIWRQMRFRWFRANYWTDPLLMPCQDAPLVEKLQLRRGQVIAEENSRSFC